MSLTIEEHYKLHGSVTFEHIESLLGCQAALENMVRVSDTDVRAGFPDEDFLNPIFEKMHSLEKQLRGPNKLALGMIIEELETIALQTARSVEYALDELKKCEG